MGFKYASSITYIGGIVGYCNGCGLEVEFQRREENGLEIWVCPKCGYRIIRLKPGRWQPTITRR